MAKKRSCAFECLKRREKAQSTVNRFKQNSTRWWTYLKCNKSEPLFCTRPFTRHSQKLSRGCFTWFATTNELSRDTETKSLTFTTQRCWTWLSSPFLCTWSIGKELAFTTNWQGSLHTCISYSGCSICSAETCSTENVSDRKRSRRCSWSES